MDKNYYKYKKYKKLLKGGSEAIVGNEYNHKFKALYDTNSNFIKDCIAILANKDINELESHENNVINDKILTDAISKGEISYDDIVDLIKYKV